MCLMLTSLLKRNTLGDEQVGVAHKQGRRIPVHFARNGVKAWFWDVIVLHFCHKSIAMRARSAFDLLFSLLGVVSILLFFGFLKWGGRDHWNGFSRWPRPSDRITIPTVIRVSLT